MPKRNRNRRNRASITKKSLSGHKIKVPRSPPAFSATPYYFLTVALQLKTSAASTQCVTINNVLKAWQEQTGVKAIPQLCLRFQSLRAWDITGFPLDITIDTLPDGTQCTSYSDTVITLIDYPGRMTYAAAGYRWPLNSRLQTKTAAEGGTVVARVTLKANAIVLIYIDLYWSFGSANVADSASVAEMTTLRVNPLPRTVQTEPWYKVDQHTLDNDFE